MKKLSSEDSKRDKNPFVVVFFLYLYQTELCLLVVVDIRLKEMFGNEVVLYAVILLVPLGPTGV